jgi:hypothetical protein
VVELQKKRHFTIYPEGVDPDDRDSLHTADVVYYSTEYVFLGRKVILTYIPSQIDEEWKRA